MSTTRIKASDRTKVCQKLVTELKKKYGSRAPKADRTVLDSLLLAICLEGMQHKPAEAALARLQESFFDYNEARVSSITELQKVFDDMPEPEWRAMRTRESLQIIFEDRYSYDIEDFKKKNLDGAEKYLKQISSLTPFVISHTMMTTLGSHIVPVDDSILRCCHTLGLLPAETDRDTAADQLKAAVRKADVPLFFYLINELANDPEHQSVFARQSEPEGEDSLAILQASPTRLKDLLAGKLEKGASKGANAPKGKKTSKSSKKATASRSGKKATASRKKKTQASTSKAASKPKKKAAKKKTAKKTKSRKATKK